MAGGLGFVADASGGDDVPWERKASHSSMSTGGDRELSNDAFTSEGELAMASKKVFHWTEMSLLSDICFEGGDGKQEEKCISDPVI